MSVNLERFFEVYPGEAGATQPLGVRVDNLVFGGGLNGVDPVTRKPSGGLEGQTLAALGRLRSLVQGAGGGLENVGRVVAYVRSEDDIETVYGPWEVFFSDPTDQPSLEIRVADLPSGELVQIDGYAVVGEGYTSRAASFQEIRVSEGARPVAAKLDALVYAPAIQGFDPQTGALVEGGTEPQLRQALANMDAIMAQAGGSRASVARVTVFMRDLQERVPVLNPVWAEWYPDDQDRPPHKYMPASLPDGVNVSLQVIGLIGAGPRQVLEVPGVRHGDPMSMGARLGNLVTTSRILTGQLPEGAGAEERTAQLFENARIMMRQAGGDGSELVQTTVLIGDEQYRELVQRVFAVASEGAKQKPRLNVLVTDLGRESPPRLEILGLL
jgi:2-iminobutanoate/2-iminopropanoate deaminase